MEPKAKLKATPLPPPQITWFPHPRREFGRQFEEAKGVSSTCHRALNSFPIDAPSTGRTRMDPFPSLIHPWETIITKLGFHFQATLNPQLPQGCLTHQPTLRTAGKFLVEALDTHSRGGCWLCQPKSDLEDPDEVNSTHSREGWSLGQGDTVSWPCVMGQTTSKSAGISYALGCCSYPPPSPASTFSLILDIHLTENQISRRDEV